MVTSIRPQPIATILQDLDRARRGSGKMRSHRQCHVGTRIREHQWDVAWINHVHETFRTVSGSAASRQRTLALSLSRAKGPVRIADIPKLDADLGRAYATVTPRTLHRDIEALISLDLVVYEDRTVRAHRERLLAFLPWRNLASR